ncbi:MAG: GNAT family N-acetyltransferase [Lachnospiraceae bacterium]|nr:GNAT family N-acetyltransferase [Lachnospiraceae bacterium]
MHRLYENEDITVFWDSDKCRHARQCVYNSPEVFNRDKRPWIDISAAENAKIWQTVEKCPTGALTCAYNHGIRIEFDEARECAIALDGDAEIGECCYEAGADGWTIYHTGVRPEYGGKGIAKRLVFKVLEEAERRKITPHATCSYAAKILVPGTMNKL